MKILIVGCGSIGRRHAKNLKELGAEVIGTDTSSESRKWIEENLEIKTFDNLEVGLKDRPDAVFVCTPPSSHIKIAEKAIKTGAHVFIEKPISDSLAGIEELEKLAKTEGKVVQIGYNLRYIPGLAKIKEMIETEEYGKALSARVIFAQSLPYWRPEIDYTKGYTGKKEHGGGIILEASHELDYICWLLGTPIRLSCFARKVSSLKVNTEDTADIIVDFEGGPVANIHLDFIRQNYTRNCEIVCEKATIGWELGWKASTSDVKLWTFDPKNPEKIKCEKIFSAPWEVNEMYKEEVKAFIKSIKEKTEPSPGIRDARLALDLVFKSLESSEKGKVMKI